MLIWYSLVWCCRKGGGVGMVPGERTCGALPKPHLQIHCPSRAQIAHAIPSEPVRSDMPRQSAPAETRHSTRACRIHSVIKDICCTSAATAWPVSGCGGERAATHPRHTRTTREETKQGFYCEKIAPPVALRIGLLRSSAPQNNGHDVNVTLQLRIPRDTNFQSYWEPSYLLIKSCLLLSFLVVLVCLGSLN